MDFRVFKVFRDFRDLKDPKDLDSGMDWCDELVEAATKWKGERWISEKIAKFAIQAVKTLLQTQEVSFQNLNAYVG